MTFWYTKFINESLNSDSVMSWKLQFYPWVHSWTLQRRKSHFVTIKDISKYTNLLMKIPSLAERWHFDALNTIKKVEIPISWSFGNFNFTHGSIVEHFKQQRVTLLQSKISTKYTNLLMTIPSLVERWHFDAINTIKKVEIPISWSFGNFNFTHGYIVEHFKQERVTLLQSKISRNILICLWRLQV